MLCKQLYSCWAANLNERNSMGVCNKKYKKKDINFMDEVQTNRGCMIKKSNNRNITKTL